MIFISRKQFEEEVSKRLGKALDDEFNRRHLCTLEERIDKLDFRITRLEDEPKTRNEPTMPDITVVTGNAY